MNGERSKRLVRRPWASFVLFALVLGASAGGILILGSSAARGSVFERYSTYRAEPDGTSALFETLQELGFQCTRQTEDLRSLPDDGSLLVLVGPFPNGDPSVGAGGAKANPFAALMAPMPEGEAEKIVAWVERGGRLLVLEGHENTLYQQLKVEVGGSPEPLENVTFDGKPSSYTVYTATGCRLSLSSHASFVAPPAGWNVLWKNREGDAVGIARPMGEGEVVLLSDPGVATNDGLTRAGNLVAVAEVAQSSPRGSKIVRFDEIRHGFAATRNVMGFARRHGLHVAIVQGLIAFVLAIWAAGRARRRPRGIAARSRIESREFVSAMANIYSRGRMSEHAARSFLRRCERALAIALGERPARLPDDEVASRLRDRGVRNFRGWETIRDEALSLGLASDIFPKAEATQEPVSGSTPAVVAAPPPTTAVAGQPKIADRRLLAFARLTGNLEREVRGAAKISLDELLSPSSSRHRSDAGLLALRVGVRKDIAGRVTVVDTGKYSPAPGQKRTLVYRPPFWNNPDQIEKLIRTSPQSDTESCGGTALAYALVRLTGAASVAAGSMASTMVESIKALILAMGNPAAMTTKGYWKSFASGAMLPDELKDMGTDLYIACVNPGAIASGPGMTALEMFRFMSCLSAFGAFASVLDTFDLRIYGWPVVGATQDSYHWVLNHQGVNYSSAPDASGQAVIGTATPPNIPAGSYLGATISLANFGFITFKKNNSNYKTKEPEGVLYSNNPGGVPTKDNAGFKAADAAAIASMAAPAT